jgi:hypothetical protein
LTWKAGELGRGVREEVAAAELELSTLNELVGVRLLGVKANSVALGGSASTDPNFLSATIDGPDVAIRIPGVSSPLSEFSECLVMFDEHRTLVYFEFEVPLGEPQMSIARLTACEPPRV